MPPGWYPDPFGPTLRWWDGTTWTVHTVPIPTALLAVADPDADLAREQRAGRRASIAVVVGALPVAAGLIVAALLARHVVHDVFNNIQIADASRPPLELNTTLRLQLIGLVGLAVEILVMIWLYRAASLARRAGLPARRDPIWAFVGFIIPIVNFWFPYQVAADTLPPGDPGRSIVGWWWTWWLLQNFVGLPLLIVSLVASTTTTLILATAAAAIPVLAAYTGWKMIATIGQAHERIIAGAPR